VKSSSEQRWSAHGNGSTQLWSFAKRRANQRQQKRTPSHDTLPRKKLLPLLKKLLLLF
jgi:hypothetical protein